MRHFEIRACLLCLMAWQCATAHSQPEVARLVVSKDGTYVSDLRSNVAWSRCLEGMHWSGKTCTGLAKLASHAEAISLAKARSKEDGLRWRVPRVRELQRLVSQAAQPRPGDAAVISLESPDSWHWASSASIDTSPVNQYDYKNIQRGVTEQNASRMAFLHGWAVNVKTGAARGDLPKSTKLPVRLVRADD